MTISISNKLSIAVAICALLAACGKGDKNANALPAWVEPDSTSAVNARLTRDFSLTIDSAANVISNLYPTLTADSIPQLIANKQIETMEINGEQRVFRKSPRNLTLLHPQYNEGWRHRGCDPSAARISFVDSILQWSQGKMPDGGAHRVTVRFSIDVPCPDFLDGDTLRAWLPYPIESDRQSDIELVSTSHPDYIISTPEQSAHRTMYFAQPVAKGDTAHFEYVVSLTMSGQYNAPENILANLKPYDTSSELYRRYTNFERPHIVKLDSLAKDIVKGETNPYLCSELVFDYIVNNYPWAGAREYSTIPCIPQYVIDRGYGDCGQVSLLYISLMRSLGVPARWESGWMLHPGEQNLHDWAEVYYEGVGWVPVDVSFGRYNPAPNAEITGFYSKGIDSHRYACNQGVGDQFYPPKRFLRSETVDSQLGEVECSLGNLFYPGWDQTLQIISQTPIIK